ncbi:MAG TPA: EamA family transporter [Clostridiaceae bacterium]|nr:EamA family transporter [Clostridiaceae bacterium]
MIYLIFFIYSILRGLNAIFVKKAQKNYVRSVHDSIYFTVLFSLFQLIFLILIPPYNSYTFKFNMLVYPGFFGIFFCVSYVLMVNALKEGPTSLTNVVYSFQSIVPIIVGLIIWEESISIMQFVGLILFILVLYLFNKGSYSQGEDKKRVTPKWALLASLSTLTVGIAVIFTKQYMLVFDGFIKEYLIFYNIVVIIISIPYLLISKLKYNKSFITDRKFILYTALPGLFTDLTNIVYMYYITRFKSAFFFPLVSILSILSVVLFSWIILKERISKSAYAGIVLSFLAIYLLGMK